MNKLKTYVITLSANYLKGHSKEGQPTYFSEKFRNGVLHTGYYSDSEDEHPAILTKIHTMRSNFPLWKARIKEVQEGNAILSVRGWIGKPYRSKQYVIADLNKDSGIGIQEAIVSVHGPLASLTCLVEGKEVDPTLFANNDGLSLEDFADWFLPELTGLKQGGVIQFTDFRY